MPTFAPTSKSFFASGSQLSRNFSGRKVARSSSGVVVVVVEVLVEV
jgi:hypothetical protein